MSQWQGKGTPEMAACVFDGLQGAYGSHFMRRYLDWLELQNSKKIAKRAKLETKDLEFITKSERMIVSCRGDEIEAAFGKDIQQVRKEIEQAQRFRELAEAKREFRELRSKRARDLIAMEQLALFVVEPSFVHPHQEDFSSTKQPMVVLSVVNRTEYRIAKAYIRVSWKLAGGATGSDRLEKGVQYAIPGGLEPGSAVEWRLSGHSFPELGVVENPDGIGLTVTTTRLDGPDGKPLFEREWTTMDEERLAALRWKLGAELASR